MRNGNDNDDDNGNYYNDDNKNDDDDRRYDIDCDDQLCWRTVWAKNDV